MKKQYKCEGEYGKHLYSGDSRYENIWKQMQLLQIEDVSTLRQEKNGTIAWQLPIKCCEDKFIEVASFKSGYVRNQNGGCSNYQLNKRCESEPQYYQLASGDYRKYTTRTCKLIPNEIDRLEYLIAYCLKNYYIKNANQVAEGSYVSKWYHEWELERNQNLMEEICHIDANADAKIKDLKNTINNLENKLATIERISTIETNVWGNKTKSY